MNLTDTSPTKYSVPTHLRSREGELGEIVDLNDGNGWVTVRWPSGIQADYYAPTLYHGMAYMYATEGV